MLVPYNRGLLKISAATVLRQTSVDLSCGADLAADRITVTIPAKVTFGLVPVTDASDARVAISDLCRALSEATGVSVLPHRAPSAEALASAIHARRVHLAWMSPTLFVTSLTLAEVTPLVQTVREGAAAYHSALFVEDQSPLRSLSSLKRVRAAWVSPTSAAGYLVPRIALARRGLDLRAVFASETFYKSHSAVAAAVLEGRADVGATFAVFRGGDPHEPLLRAGFDGISEVAKARVIDVAGPVPADMVVCQMGVPYAVRSRLARALRALGDDAAMKAVIGKLFGADGFVDFEPDALQSLRDIVEAGRQLAVA